jgi:ABC-type multidrug transport system fused ATPase/permease subunit
MEDGRIIERGTHDALMETRGEYYRMVVRQMEAQAREGDEVLRA